MTIQRVNHGRGHKYVNIDTGARIPGVTSFVDNGVPKKALINWSARATIDYAIDHWAELSELPISERMKRLGRARYETTSKAKARGTKVHNLAARLVLDEEVRIPEGLEGYVEAYVRFLDEFEVKPVLVEAVVVSHTHSYCGTLDLLADLVNPEDPDGDLVRWLLDIKLTRSGVYGETGLQLSGYRYADAWVDDDGNESPIPPVEETGVVWVRPDGYDLVPVEAGLAEHRNLLYAAQIAEFVANSYSLVGEPISPPRPSTFRLVRD